MIRPAEEVGDPNPLMAGFLAVETAILGGSAALAALILTDQRSLRTEVSAVETRLGKRIDDTQSELRGEINAVGTRLENRIARLTDHLDGLAAPRRGVPPSAPTPDESPA